MPPRIFNLTISRNRDGRAARRLSNANVKEGGRPKSNKNLLEADLLISKPNTALGLSKSPSIRKKTVVAASGDGRVLGSCRSESESVKSTLGSSVEVEVEAKFGFEAELKGGFGGRDSNPLGGPRGDSDGEGGDLRQQQQHPTGKTSSDPNPARSYVDDPSLVMRSQRYEFGAAPTTRGSRTLKVHKLGVKIRRQISAMFLPLSSMGMDGREYVGIGGRNGDAKKKRVDGIRRSHSLSSGLLASVSSPSKGTRRLTMGGDGIHGDDHTFKLRPPTQQKSLVGDERHEIFGPSSRVAGKASPITPINDTSSPDAADRASLRSTSTKLSFSSENLRIGRIITTSMAQEYSGRTEQDVDSEHIPSVQSLQALVSDPSCYSGTNEEASVGYSVYGSGSEEEEEIINL